MKNIQGFLDKFLSIKPTSRIVVREVVSVLTKKGIPISEDEVLYSQNIVYIKANSVIKNEVFFIKNEVVSEVNKNLTQKVVKEIR